MAGMAYSEQCIKFVGVNLTIVGLISLVGAGLKAGLHCWAVVWDGDGVCCQSQTSDKGGDVVELHCCLMN